MRNLLYIIVAILLIAWGIGFFAYKVTGLIHVLLVMAFITVVLSFIKKI